MDPYGKVNHFPLSILSYLVIFPKLREGNSYPLFRLAAWSVFSAKFGSLEVSSGLLCFSLHPGSRVPGSRPSWYSMSCELKTWPTCQKAHGAVKNGPPSRNSGTLPRSAQHSRPPELCICSLHGHHWSWWRTTGAGDETLSSTSLKMLVSQDVLPPGARNWSAKNMGHGKMWAASQGVYLNTS